MNLEQKIIAARPHDTATTRQFVTAVRQRLDRKPRTRSYGYCNALFRRSPALAVLAILAGLIVLTGTVYAVSYLWPRLVPGVSQPQKSASGRQSVIVTQCDAADSTKHYELKEGAPVPADKINDVVTAQCELNALTKWAQEAYPIEQRPERADINTPGAEFEHNYVLPAMLVVKIVKMNEHSLTVADSGSSMERDLQLSPDVKYIIDGKYGSLSQFQPGDAVSYVSRSSTKTRNRDDCTDIHCQGDVVSSSETALDIVKMKYSFDVYQAIRYLTELEVCMGNPNDECPSLSYIDLYERIGAGDDSMTWANISGKVSGYTDQSITIITTSGRQVKVNTPWNIIRQFNSEKSSDYGLTVHVGDSLNIAYNQLIGTTQDSEIPWEQLVGVRLLLELESKGAPLRTY